MICKVPVKVTFKNTKFMERIRLKATFYNGDEPVKYLIHLLLEIIMISNSLAFCGMVN